MNTISLEKFKDEKNIPFFSWQCITLQLVHRDVDLVLKNQEDMDHLLKFLIYEMNTINGKRDSGLKLQQLLVEKRLKNASHISNWRL
jgi:hypothetical protein